MCAAALSLVRIRAVYYGAANDRFGGTGSCMNLHTDRHVHPWRSIYILKLSIRMVSPTCGAYSAHGGYLKEEAIGILKEFYGRQNTRGILIMHLSVCVCVCVCV